MKLLINTSNLYVGGGVQVAVSFIKELLYLKDQNKYMILLSPVIKKQLERLLFTENFKFKLVDKSPSSLLSRKRIVKYLNSIEEEYNPDLVFSVFGPSYWRPKNKHIIGFADGWVYNQDSVAYEKLSFFKRLKMRMIVQYKIFYLKYTADYFVLETQDAAQKLTNILNKPMDKFYVVGNTFSNIFNDIEYLNKENKSYLSLKKKDDDFFFIYIAHNHPAKNISVLNKVIPLLKNSSIKFVLTIDSKSYDSIFIDEEVKKQVINLGPINLTSCPSVYSQCNALFAPTLLETFSAAYPEAMKMGIPILTSNFSFATDICKDAALYFNPLDPKDISKNIKELVSNTKLQKDLILKGKKRVVKFETATSRAVSYIKLCENIVEYS